MRIGSSGHRPNRLHIPIPLVRARLDEVLAHLKAEATAAGGNSPVAISALAEGADRLFALSALDLGFQLEAVLPMPAVEYMRTFADQSTTAVFQSLLDRASDRHVLPGSLKDTKSAYEALGHRIADDCDVLVVVWDGKPAAGRGGTFDVIGYALNSGRRVIWVDAASDRMPQDLRAIHPAIQSVPMI